MTLLGRVRAAVAATALVGLTLLAVARPAAGASSVAAGAACPDANGVTVVVDFHGLGGGVRVGCAPSPTTGLDALTQAGFEVRTALRSAGFVCRIDKVPTTDPCVDPSPSNAYWSYWHASRGGTWSYSDLGAGNRAPAPGSVEGWSFSQDASGSAIPPPGIAPPNPAVVATTVTPTTAAPPAGATPTIIRPSMPTTTRAGVTTAPPPTTGATASTSTTAPDATAATSTTAPMAPTTVTPDPTIAIARVESATAVRSVDRSDDDGGAPIGSILAVGAVVVLGSGAVLGARRRRSAEP